MFFQYQFKYRGASAADLSPHIFGMADQTYHAMLHEKKGQSIVITGESGSGKTESSKFLLQQLVYLGKVRSSTWTLINASRFYHYCVPPINMHKYIHTSIVFQAPNRNLEAKILEVNHILEAFGNAETGMNRNSSRFGKYFNVTFTRTGKITGAEISAYLLEESRVDQQEVYEFVLH